MALLLVAPPDSVLTTFEESLLDFMGPHPPAAHLYHLPVGTLTLAEAGAGAKLADAAPSGCRILASWPDGTHTSCEMTNPSLYGNAQFRNFATGDPVIAVIGRIVEAQALSPVQAQDYELHFLSIPGIYLEALHLVSQASTPDLLLPLISLDPRVDVRAVLEEPAFLAIARASAAVRIKLISNDPLSS